MNKNFCKGFLLLFFFLGLIHIASATHAVSDEIQWQTYQNGIANAKSEGKKIFLHFYSTLCGYCKIMDQKTFKDASVVQYLNENFVPIKVNADQQRELAIQYRVTGLPSNWFLQTDSEKIANRPGYIAPEEMISFLKFIHTDSYKKMSLSEFLQIRK
ncbi:MAG: thioredoxin [Desulfobacterium sp.]|nr:thioredoxin [Desulfobacterium sp.]